MLLSLFSLAFILLALLDFLTLITTQKYVAFLFPGVCVCVYDTGLQLKKEKKIYMYV